MAQHTHGTQKHPHCQHTCRRGRGPQGTPTGHHREITHIQEESPRPHKTSSVGGQGQTNSTQEFKIKYILEPDTVWPNQATHIQIDLESMVMVLRRLLASQAGAKLFWSDPGCLNLNILVVRDSPSFWPLTPTESFQLLILKFFHHIRIFCYLLAIELCFCTDLEEIEEARYGLQPNMILSCGKSNDSVLLKTNQKHESVKISLNLPQFGGKPVRKKFEN